MPRHFARRVYGPYFPYDHVPHEKKHDEKYIENKINYYMQKVRKLLTFKK